MNGYTLMHEHITIDLSGIKKDTDCQLDCYAETVEEFKKLYEHGVRTVVDVTNDGMGRNVPYVLNVEKETGIRIIQSTGFYKEPFLPERVYGQTVRQMADWMIGEITVGIDATHFDPDAPCTRAQVVTFLWRAAGKPAASGTIPFKDVPANKWYAQPVLWAVQNGITYGMTATEFDTEGTCTRGQVVTFLYRTFG